MEQPMGRESTSAPSPVSHLAIQDIITHIASLRLELNISNAIYGCEVCLHHFSLQLVQTRNV